MRKRLQLKQGRHQSQGRTLLLTVGVAVLLAGCAGETASGDVRPGPAGSGAVRVVMEDDAFQPDVLEVSAGSPVTVEVRNVGIANHNFTIDERSSVARGMRAWSGRSSRRSLKEDVMSAIRRKPRP